MDITHSVALVVTHLCQTSYHGVHIVYVCYLPAGRLVAVASVAVLINNPAATEVDIAFVAVKKVQGTRSDQFARQDKRFPG